jgi:hypothetical protein
MYVLTHKPFQCLLSTLMMATEMRAKLLDAATNDAHKPISHQNIPVFNMCTVRVNDLKCKYLILCE